MARIALLTLEDRTGFVIDDALAVDELRARGHHVDEVPWSRADTDWTAYALVVVRTPWDYTLRPDEFLATLARIESLGVPLENPRSVVAWNLHKSYLRDLESRGMTIVPTRWGTGLDPAALRGMRDTMAERLTPGPSPQTERGVMTDFVLKPVISANAKDTFVIDARTDDATLARIAALYANREWMAQPFVRSVVEEGEYSLFYFGGTYSHAIVKRPKTGDFRVQEEHGGIIRAVDEPPHDVRVAAERVLARIGRSLLQARIDLVHLDDGNPALMEAELIEPSLYFRFHPRAAANFADAVESRVR